MLSSTCGNCGRGKSRDFYSANYCEDCTKAIADARTKASEAGTDLGNASRLALAQRAHDVHSNRYDPRRPPTKSDYWVPK